MKKILASIIIIAFSLVLIGIVYLAFQSSSNENQLFPPDIIRGSAIIANEMGYTLNYAQQKELINLLNDGKIEEHPHLEIAYPKNVQKIIFYLFDNLKPTELTPINKNFSYFSVSNWPKNHYLLIRHPQKMKALLEGAFDH